MSKQLQFSIPFILIVVCLVSSQAFGFSSPPLDSHDVSEDSVVTKASSYLAQTDQNFLPLILKSNTKIYVDVEASGLTNGTSWEDAFTTLQPAMDEAVSGDEVWVAAGTYFPTVEHCGSGDPSYQSFQLKNGVGVYGGFDPSSGDAGWTDRDWVVNVTILSGDIGVPGDLYDNSSHVFCHPEGLNLDSSAILDGFTITDGHDSGMFGFGGGMFNKYSSPALTNVTFANNSGRFGGGMNNEYSSPTLTNVTFDNNSGGGIYNAHSSPTLTNVIFSNNSSWDDGGGMSNFSSSPILTNVTFSHNSTISGYHGGGLANTEGSFPILTDVAFIGNSAGIGGGMYNEASSPTLTNVTFTENSADEGGGMENEFSSPVLENVTFYRNFATYGGAMSNYYSAPVMTNVTFSFNGAYQGQGGAMINYNHSLPILNFVTFSGNEAWDGGGMMNSASSPTLTNVTFTNNFAYASDFHGGSGGGMLNMNGSSPLLTNVTFSVNAAGHYGGGMVNSGASSPVLTNVTFSNNSAGDEGGGMANFSSSTPTLVNVTFSENSANNGGAIYNTFDTFTTLTNCILWGDSPNEIVNDVDSSSTITYSDIWMIDGSVYPGTGNIAADPLLGPLADNGGFVFTHALGAGSQVIDTGNPDPATCPATDARGEPRPQDGDDNGTATCDMGSYEFEEFSASPR